MATSAGMAANDMDRMGPGFVQDSIFKLLDENWSGAQERDAWRIYFEQIPSALSVEYPRFQPDRMKLMPRFFEDVEKGDLPLFSWLDHAYYDWGYFPASDQVLFDTSPVFTPRRSYANEIKKLNAAP